MCPFAYGSHTWVICGDGLESWEFNACACTCERCTFDCVLVCKVCLSVCGLSVSGAVKWLAASSVLNWHAEQTVHKRGISHVWGYYQNENIQAHTQTKNHRHANAFARNVHARRSAALGEYSHTFNSVTGCLSITSTHHEQSQTSRRKIRRSSL